MLERLKELADELKERSATRGTMARDECRPLAAMHRLRGECEAYARAAEMVENLLKDEAARAAGKE